jgi:hypothetical protein
MDDAPLPPLNGDIYLGENTLTATERALIFGATDAPREDATARMILEGYRQCSVKEINDEQFKMALAVLLGKEEGKRVYNGLYWSLTAREMFQQQSR